VRELTSCTRKYGYGAQERQRSRQNEWFYETPTEDTCGVKVNRVGEMQTIREKRTKEVGGHGGADWWYNAGKGADWRRKVCPRDSQSESVSNAAKKYSGNCVMQVLSSPHRDQTICPISEREVASRPQRFRTILKHRSQNKDLYLAPRRKEVISQWEKEGGRIAKMMRTVRDRLRSDEFKEKTT
jgi:hypothetical protein